MIEDEKSRKAARLVEAAALVLEGAGGTLPTTSLNKALFYLDLRALLDLGEPITGTTFLALPAGPVVAKYEKRLIGELEDRDIAQQFEDDDGVTKPISLVADAPRNVLSDKEATLARQLGRWAAENSPKQLSKYSHDNIGWRMAWSTGLGGELRRAKPIDLLVAMQQLAEPDEWVTSENLDDETASAFAEADETPGVKF